MTEEWRLAVQNGDVVRLRALLEAGADINALDRYGKTALMIASVRGHTETVGFLVQCGARLNHTAKHHLSALMLAVINDHRDVVRILIDGGADLEIRGTGAPGFYGKTALDLAADLGRKEVIAIFLENAKR